MAADEAMGITCIKDHRPSDAIDSERGWLNDCALCELERLRGALEDAIYEVENWAAYAGEYFQKKHNLKGTIIRLRAFLGPNVG